MKHLWGDVDPRYIGNSFKEVEKWSNLMSKALKEYYHWDRIKIFNNPEPFKKVEK